MSAERIKRNVPYSEIIDSQEIEWNRYKDQEAQAKLEKKQMEKARYSGIGTQVKALPLPSNMHKSMKDDKKHHASLAKPLKDSNNRHNSGAGAEA